MNLMEVGRRDEALLLDLLNTTPVAAGRSHDVLTEQPQAWLREHDAAEAELGDLVPREMCFRRWCAEPRRRSRCSRFSTRWRCGHTRRKKA